MSAADRPSRLARQLKARRGRDSTRDPHRPEYDANGFPVPHRNSSFVKRVARLLNAR